MLSTVSTLSPEGVLTITADNAPNTVNVSRNLARQVVVTTNPLRGLDKPATFPIDQVKSIVFNGGKAANTFSNNSFFPAQINGHGVGDVLTGGIFGDVITEDSASAKIIGGTNTTFVANSDAFFTLNNSKLTTASGSYDLLLVFNVVLNLSGPLASKGGGHVDLTGYGGSATVNSQGGVRTDYFLGTGATAINAGSGLNVVSANNVGSARFAGGVLTVNGVQNTLKNVTNINLTNAGGANSIDLNGFKGDSFITIAKPGNATVRGGLGSNTIVSSAGTNLVLPSGGNDLVGGSNVTKFALPTANVSPSQRNVSSGPASVLLQPDGFLVVAGPTGVGFSLQGNWSASSTSTGRQTFTATGNVVLHTAAGDLPFTTSDPLTVTAQGSFLGFGTLVGANLTGLTLDTSDPSSPLNRLETVFGLHAAEAGATWNIALGKDIPTAAGLPVEASVPYLFTTAATGASVTFGPVSFPANGGKSITMLLDPTDPSLLVRVDGTSFQVGASLQGDILFTPDQGIVDATPVFGELYTTGVDAFNARVRFADLNAIAAGAATIDFDVSWTHNLAGVTPDLVQSLIQGGKPVTTTFPGDPSNVAIGVNGLLVAGFRGSSEPGGPINYDTSLNIRPASVKYTNGVLNFGGSTVGVGSSLDTLLPSPLSWVGSSIKSIQGTIARSTSGPAFFASSTLQFPGPLGAIVPKAVMLLTNDPTKPSIDVRAQSAPVPGVGAMTLAGTIDPNGDLRLNASTNTTAALVNAKLGPGFDLPQFYNMRGDFGLTYRGATNPTQVPTTTVGVSINPLNLPTYSNNNRDVVEHDRLDGALTPTVLPTGAIQWQGQGSVTGTADSSFFGSFPGHDPVNRAWKLVGNQIWVSLLPTFDANADANHQALTFNLNSAAFPGVNVTPVVTTKGLAVLSGRIGSPNPTSNWTLRVNWGDGSPVQTLVFPPSSNGRPISLSHHYRYPSPAGHPYQVVAQWHDNRGRGNATLLPVRVVQAR